MLKATILKDDMKKVNGGEQNEPAYCKRVVNKTCYTNGCGFCRMVYAEDGTEYDSNYQCDKGYESGVNVDFGTGYVK